VAARQETNSILLVNKNSRQHHGFPTTPFSSYRAADSLISIVRAAEKIVEIISKTALFLIVSQNSAYKITVAFFSI